LKTFSHRKRFKRKIKDLIITKEKNGVLSKDLLPNFKIDLCIYIQFFYMYIYHRLFCIPILKNISINVFSQFFTVRSKIIVVDAFKKLPIKYKNK